MSRKASCALVLLALAAGAEGEAVGLPPLDINVAATASPCNHAALKQIKGISESLANEICARGAGFDSVWQLDDISGIGEATIQNAIVAGNENVTQLVLAGSTAKRWRTPCVANATATPSGKSEGNCASVNDMGSYTTGNVSGLPFIDINKACDEQDYVGLRQIRSINNQAKAEAVCDARGSASFTSVFDLAGQVSGITANKVREMFSKGGDVFGYYRVPCVADASGTPADEHETACYPLKDAAYAVDQATHWTPWFDADEPTGDGDVEIYNVMKNKYNLCGRSATGGDTAPIDIECRLAEIEYNGTVLANATLLTDLPAGSLTAQNGVDCDDPMDGLRCYNNNNQKCWGPNAACALANDATTAANAGAAYHGIPNATSRCHEVAHLGCTWGCADYEVRFKCPHHWTAVPTTAPTTSPTASPTVSPTSVPTQSPTPAPQPRGFKAPNVTNNGLTLADAVEFIPQENWFTNPYFIRGTDGWLTEGQGTTFNIEAGAGGSSMGMATIGSSQVGNTVSMYQDLTVENRDTFYLGELYVLLVRGYGTMSQWNEGWKAEPFVECAGLYDDREDVAFDAPIDKALPPRMGAFIAIFQPNRDMTQCRAGVRVKGATVKATSAFSVKRIELRKIQPHEKTMWMSTAQAHAHGVLANGDFAWGQDFWEPISVDNDEVFTSGSELYAWNHNRPAGRQNGVQQTMIKLHPNTVYEFRTLAKVAEFTNTGDVNHADDVSDAKIFITATQLKPPSELNADNVVEIGKGDFCPCTAPNNCYAPPTHQQCASIAVLKGSIFKGTDHTTHDSGCVLGFGGMKHFSAQERYPCGGVCYCAKTTTTADVVNSGSDDVLANFMSKTGFTNIKTTFKTPADVSDIRYNVGIRFTQSTQIDGLIVMRSASLQPHSSNAWYNTTLTSTTTAPLATGATHAACNCDPRVHASKATKCYMQQHGFSRRAGVVRVVHRRSMTAPHTFEDIGMDQADTHKCKIVDNACKCCDCLDGQLHGFDLAKLQDGSSFSVKFSRTWAATADNNARPGMSGRCRFDQNSGKWCCMATNSWMGFTADVTGNIPDFDYGDEKCYAYTGNQDPEGINFWGVNYHFKEYHRCITPAAHHVCGENVQPIKSKKQDVGHLPFFDQNDLGKYAGFTVLVNSFYTANAEVSGYTTHDGKYGLPQEDANGHDICNEAVTAETTGSALTKATKHHLLTRTACAEHCDDFDSCKGFNFKEYNYNGADTSTTCEFLRVGDIANCTVTNAKTTFYSKIQSQS